MTELAQSADRLQPARDLFHTLALLLTDQVRIVMMMKILDGVENVDRKVVCFQHEMDHLNGALFIDHLSRLKRQRAIQSVTKAERDRTENDQAAPAAM